MNQPHTTPMTFTPQDAALPDAPGSLRDPGMWRRHPVHAASSDSGGMQPSIFAGLFPYPPFDPEPRYTRQQVLDALQDYAQTNGAVALKEVLDRFGARRVSDIKTEHYPEVMTIARGELA